MIESEVRIGNYYIDEDGFEHQVSARDFSWMSWEHCEPIPLTEEWLLKFGFEKKESDFQDELLDTFMWHKDNITDIEFSDKHKLLYLHDNYTSIYHQEIKHVHQLQNLYHSLVGKELNKKE